MLTKNIITCTDSYKQTHYRAYPDGTEYVYSYFESRTGAKFNYTVFLGLQYLLKEYLCGQVVTREKIDRAQWFVDQHIGPGIFNRPMWEHILAKHGGRLPVEIKAVPEGTPVPVNNVLMTVVNTDPLCFPLTNHLETLLTHVWAASTVATRSRKLKTRMKEFLDRNATDAVGLDFMLHDFGFRGVSSLESAAFCGAGHLINFRGTDTIPAVELLMDYYSASVCGFSVVATEHSVMTARGPEGEEAVFADLLNKFPSGVLSVVSDSYDVFSAARNIIGGKFRDQILARDGVFVVRPDSGEPISTILKLLEILGEAFGTTINAKSFRVLHPKVRLLWGDGLEDNMIYDILRAAEENGWAANNLIFGMGGGLLQKMNRDTQRFAFKSSAQCRSGVWFDVFKEPVDKTKASKKGRLALIRENEQYRTVRTDVQLENDCLVTVFRNGELIKEWTLDDVRKNAELSV